jgi:predicted transcriptional regulator
MSAQERKSKRAKLLTTLREEHAESVRRTKDLIREQNAIRKSIRQAMKGGATTVPELADATGLPSEAILWHVTAMRKHGVVVESDMSGDYYRYLLAEELAR